MKIGIDSFVAAVPDALTGENLGPADRLKLLLDEIEFADRVGLDVFGVGGSTTQPWPISTGSKTFLMKSGIAVGAVKSTWCSI